MCPPASYLVMVSKTKGYIAELAGGVRWPVQLTAQIRAMTGNEFEELDDYNYDLIPEIEKLKLVGT
jgi:hypothetical protein